MDTEFPVLPPSLSRELMVLPVPRPASPAPRLAPPVGREVSQLFMDSAPISWRFDLAGVSADDSGPLEVRVYFALGQALLAPRGEKAPFLSFLLPFTGQEDWSEDSVLSFASTQIMHHLSSWSPALAALISPSQFGHCIGRVKWENGICRYILPVLFSFADSVSIPLGTLLWPAKRISKTISCPLPYLERWFASAGDFRPGGDIPLLPHDSGKFDLPVSRPEAKRQRSQRS